MQLTRPAAPLIATLLAILAGPTQACTIGVSTPGLLQLSGDGHTLSSGNSGGIASVLAISNLDLDLNGTTITVNLAVAAPAGGSVVWVYIEGGAQPIVQRVQVAQTSTVGTDPLLLPPGSYRALVLAPGHQPVALQETVP